MNTIGILSDAHGNIEAFEAALGILRKLGADHFVFLGDAVGYIPSNKVVRRLMDLGGSVTCIRGNHEMMLINESFDPKRDEVYKLAKTKLVLTSEELRFIETWPEKVSLKVGRFTALMTHGSPNNSTEGYVYPDTDLEPLGNPADLVFMGHTHIPFVRQCNNTHFINVGSCGLPRDDGRLGAAAIFDASSGKVEVIRFDISEAIRNISQCLADALHPSVQSVFQRRKGDVYGKIIG